MPFKLPSFSELNNTQKLIINLLPKSDKLAIIGGPGTGKTIIAIEAAAMMANSKKKCLILSYSTSLRDQIKCIAKTFNLNIENIEINSYLRWFWRELERLGYDPKTLQEKEFVYDLSKIENALAIKSTEEKLMYDYIFIDEAQDVQDGLIKFFSQFCNKILVTFDDCQKIGNENGNDSILSYDHSNILIDLKIGDKFFDLIDNYRNTTQIETVARLLFSSYDLNDVTLKKVTSKKHGNKPKLICSNEKLSYEKIAKYIVDHYDKSKSVAILFDSTSPNKTALFNKLKEAINNEIKRQNQDIKFLYKYGKNSTINSNNSLDNAIFLMSFRTSKGLEFEEVFVLTTDVKIDNYQKRNAFYVAFTRAKSMTYVAVDNASEYNDEINKLVLDNAYLFDVDNI
jgi:superfamily I DNA and RNA helicase